MTTHGGARASSGRKPTGSALKTVTVGVSPVAAAWLKKLSREHGSSQAKIVEHLILTVDELPSELKTARK